MKKRLSLALLTLVLVSITLSCLAADSLVVTEDAAFVLPEENAYKVVGVITNQGKTAADAGFARVDLLDKAGKQLHNSSSIAVPGRLEPGESAYFSILISDVDGKDVASHTITPQQEEIGALLPLPVTLISALDQLNEEEGIMAEYINNTGAELSSARTVWILRDEAGKLIDIIVFRSNFQEPLADGAKNTANYYFGFMTPTLADSLEKGLAKGSAVCLVYAIVE